GKQGDADEVQPLRRGRREEVRPGPRRAARREGRHEELGARSTGGSGRLRTDFGLAVFAAVLDLHVARERGVDRAVAVAGPVDRLVDQLLVCAPIPRAVERDLDALESLWPLLVAIALDLDLLGTQRLLELLQEKHGVEACAPPQAASSISVGRMAASSPRTGASSTCTV